MYKLFSLFPWLDEYNQNAEKERKKRQQEKSRFQYIPLCTKSSSANASFNPAWDVTNIYRKFNYWYITTKFDGWQGKFSKVRILICTCAYYSIRGQNNTKFSVSHDTIICYGLKQIFMIYKSNKIVNLPIFCNFYPS